MRLPTKKAAAFAASCALTAAGWTLFWPEPASHSPAAASPPATLVNEPPHWPQEKLQSLIDGVEKAPEGAIRLEACRRLSEIPLADVPAALEITSPVQSHHLTLAAQVLLIRWADNDGEAAVKWAWRRFRDGRIPFGENQVGYDQVWDEAFRQISAAWAYHDPKQFGNWVLDRIPADPDVRTGHPTQAQKEASEQPLLSSGEWYEMTTKCLLRDSPHLAFQVLLKWHVSGSGDAEYANLLETVEQVKEALLAFDLLQETKPDVPREGDQFAQPLLERWRKLDPKDFARSPYHSLVGKLLLNDRMRTWPDLPPEERREAADRLAADMPSAAREGLLASLVSEWMPKDPEACREWMETLPEKDSDDVVKSYAAGLAAIDPVQAFEWMKKFPAIKRQKAIAAACNALSLADQGGRQDFTGWSEGEIEAWKDLTALREVTGKRR
ncbi:MAG: hypothetical protein JWO82_1541 [Akkermansiaceae bacterium]|nr:hypothetical protein [Akkermansiaceae bacterium]